MEKSRSIKQVLLSQIEAIAINEGYDFLYEGDENEVLGQIIERDDAGSIMDTPLSFQLSINEEKGNGTIIYYQPEGEVARKNFNLENTETILTLLGYVETALRTYKIKN